VGFFSFFYFFFFSPPPPPPPLSFFFLFLGQGKTITFEARTMATHVVYGFLNCKTYSVILLLLLSAQGCQINLTIWALE